MLLGAMSCGPSWKPKQAQFALTDCTAAAAVGAPEEWRWQTERAPVLGRGPAGAWDSVDALNPSVALWNSRFYNLYSGYDGKTWCTGLAVSSDGRTWEKDAGNPVLAPLPDTWEGDYIAANGSVLHNEREFLYWYQGGRKARIGLAQSADARRWQRHGPPVLEPGPPGAWDDEAVADPYVIQCGQMYYMYYLGQSRRGLQRVGVARSSDGVAWQKFPGNPVLDLGPPGSFDERGLGEPAVFRGSREFYMIYTGRDRAENRRLGVARSEDGVRWSRAAWPDAPGGDQAWNSRVVCDPSVLTVERRLLLWFGGGDVASLDENLHGQIGFATLEFR